MRMPFLEWLPVSEDQVVARARVAVTGKPRILEKNFC